MKNATDVSVKEVSMKSNAITDLETYIQEGEDQRDAVNNIAREQELREFSKGIFQSPLRKARYQSMKGHLRRQGEYILKKRTPRSFHEFGSWTREQIEQALDDVILCGYGEVVSYQRGGALFINFINKEKQPNVSTRS